MLISGDLYHYLHNVEGIQELLYLSEYTDLDKWRMIAKRIARDEHGIMSIDT